MNETGIKLATKRGTHIDKLQKAAVMEMYRLNGNNASKTSIESGVSRSTMNKWIKTDESIVKNKPVKEVTEKLLPVITQDDITKELANISNYLSTSKVLRDVVLKRMIVLVAKEKDVKKLAGLLETLYKHINPLEDVKKPGVITGSSTVNNNNVQANFVCNEKVLALIAEKFTRFNENN